jgi:predicted MFS family arabinose efflux permease
LLYCGLSGILNSLLFVGLLQMWHDHRHPLVALTAALALLKIAVEAASGQPLLTHTAWPSVPVVHAAGVLCGVVIAAVFRISQGRQTPLVLLGSVNE